MKTQLIHKPAWPFLKIWCFHTWCFPHDALLISEHKFCSHFLMVQLSLTYSHHHLVFSVRQHVGQPGVFSADPKSVLCGRVTLFFLTLGRSCHGALLSGPWLLSLSPCFSIARSISPFISHTLPHEEQFHLDRPQSLNRAPCCPILRNKGLRFSELLMTVI